MDGGGQPLSNPDGTSSTCSYKEFLDCIGDGHVNVFYELIK